MIQILSVLFFIFGLVVGSFLNVVAYRSAHGGSVFFGSSICPKCKHKLGPVDLIPIVSYLLLKGRCRYCHGKISWQYPLVELATGFLFALTFYYWSTNIFNNLHLTSYILHLVYLLFVVSVLIVLFTTDLRDGLLPNSVILSAIVIVMVYKLLLLFSNSVSAYSLSIDLVASILVASVFFALVYLSGEKALGGGDPKFAFFIALATSWPAILVALYLAFLTGGLVAAMLILMRKRRFGQTVPLGPFLSIGALVALFWGQQVIDFYLKGFY